MVTLEVPGALALTYQKNMPMTGRDGRDFNVSGAVGRGHQGEVIQARAIAIGVEADDLESSNTKTGETQVG